MSIRLLEQREQGDIGDNDSIDNLPLYRLDYEEFYHIKSQRASTGEKVTVDPVVLPRAAGGEVLQPGDHIYMWCTLYQHHGIVLEVYPGGTGETCGGGNPPDNNADDVCVDSIINRELPPIPEATPEHVTQTVGECLGKTNEAEFEITPASQASPPPNSSDADQVHGNSILIAEFTNAELALEGVPMFASASTAAGATSGGGVTGGFRIVLERHPHLKWHKVKYNANPIECMTWRPGTCSGSSRLPTAHETLTRVHFLHECRHLIPDYHLFASNCETVAVWCATGKWETLQGERVLQWGSLGAAAAAASMVMAPVGMALAVATSGGLALWRSQHINKKWDTTEALLNQHYAWYAMGKTPTFCFQVTS